MLFNQYFNEALSLSTAREHKLTRKKGGAYDNDKLNQIFGDEDRLVYDITIDRSAMVDHPMMNDVNEFFDKLNINYLIPNIESYITGVAYNPNDRDRKQPNKVGKILNKVVTDTDRQGEFKFNDEHRKEADELGTQFRDDPIRSAQCKEYKVIISRHPYDIAGMSTDRSWWSCMHLGSQGIAYKTKDPGKNRRFVQGDIEEGSIVAYLICSNDVHKNGKYAIRKPYSRILMKPHISPEESGEVHHAFTMGMMYGAAIPEFQKFIRKWLTETVNTDTEGREYYRPKNLYRDRERDRPVNFNLLDHTNPIAYREFSNLLAIHTQKSDITNHFKLNMDDVENSTSREAVLSITFPIPQNETYKGLIKVLAGYKPSRPLSFLSDAYRDFGLNYASTNPKIIFDMNKYVGGVLTVYFTLKDIAPPTGNETPQEELKYWKRFFQTVGIGNLNYTEMYTDILNAISSHLLEVEEDF